MPSASPPSPPASPDATRRTMLPAIASRPLRQPCSRRRCASVQDVQIGVVEREQARLLNRGLREHRSCRKGRQHCGDGDGFECFLCHDTAPFSLAYDLLVYALYKVPGGLDFKALRFDRMRYIRVRGFTCSCAREGHADDAEKQLQNQISRQSKAEAGAAAA